MENETMTTPTLVFGEVLPSAPEEPAKKEPEQPQLNEEILTAEERKMVEDFSRSDRSDKFHCHPAVRSRNPE